jgi:hypothetical protein
MAISGVNPKCYILALFVRDDGARFLLGDDPFEFKDNQLHFQQNTMANDVVEVQGNDGYLLAGQVRRPGTQVFDGYVCNGTNSKEEVEAKRRSFLQFFRRSHFYKVIYVFPNGTAIQRKQGFLVDDPTVQELYQQYPEYHVALNFEDVNYYTYEEDDQGHEIYAKEAIVSLAGGGATGGLIWDSYGVVWEDAWSLPLSISGVQFQILNNAGARAPIENVELYGDTYQQTYSGKNLWDFNGLPNKNYMGSNLTINEVFESGAIVTGNTSTSTVDSANSKGWFAPAVLGDNAPKRIPLNNGDTFTISADVTIIETGYSNTIYIGRYLGTVNQGLGQGNTLTVGVKTRISATFTASASGGYSPYITLSSCKVKIENIQFEKSSTATSYEPYTGGIPAPNPDYPQDIQVVTGEQTVTISNGVSSQSYPISLTGKNLFNVSATPTYLNGVSVSGNIQVTATSSGTNKYALYRLVEAKNYVGSKVCVSCSAMHPSSTNDARIEIGLCNADGTSKTSKAYTNNVNLKPSFTVTDDPSKPYIYVALYASYSSSASVGAYVGYGKVMVNRGSTPGTYASYSPIELCKIGDYQDYIYKSGDDWYVHKEVQHLSLGISDMNNNEQYPGWKNMTVLVDTLGSDLNNRLDRITQYLSNILSSDSSSADMGILSANTRGSGSLFFQSGNWNQTYWKTTYPNLTLELYYRIIVSQTDTKITDATLVGQLNALGAMKLFIGENNLLVSTSTPNLPATLAFDYYTKFAAIGAEWEEGGTKGATIVDVDAIDNTYPVWELTGPATNPTLSVLTTNTTLTYNGTITASQKLIIDMFNKTATLNGTSVIGNISGDFVYMAPGTNRLAYTAGNTDAPDSTIYWQEVVG